MRSNISIGGLPITFIIVLILIMQAPLLQGQLAAKGSDSTRFEFKSYALQLAMTDLGDFNSFQGSLISIKYHFSNRWAIRIGVGFDADARTYQRQQSIDQMDSIYYDFEDELNDRTLRMISQIVYYVRPQATLKLFTGLGPYFEYSRTRLDNKKRQLDEKYYGNVYLDRERNRTALGLSAVYGLEWFFSRQMSLTAEYGFRLYYFEEDESSRLKRYYTNIDDYVEYTENASQGWRMNDIGLLVGLSLYF
ncbi:MAG: hypothetical protein GF313_01235 [Caldithrix sp.]|nr:hypothetical protein [Caldithrix sp.]